MVSTLKILAFGSREWTDKTTIFNVFENAQGWFHDRIILVQGESKGADTLAKEVALELGWEVRSYPANWKEHGKAAGPIRNQEQLTKEHPDRDGLLIDIAYGFICNKEFFSGKTGSLDMAKRLAEKGVPIVIRYKP